MSNLRTLFIGDNGFPHGFGAVQRILLLARGIQAQGGEAMVLCYKGVHNPEEDFPPEGEYQGLRYKYMTGNIYRPSGFLRRNLEKISGKIKELSYIRKLWKQGKADVCFVSTHDTLMLMLYWAWLKWIGMPMVLNYVELNSAIASRTGFRERVNDWFFDRLAPRLNDAVCPISDFLIAEVEKYAPRKPYFKTPILCDFTAFDPAPASGEEIRFVYCGAASYWELIRFVLGAFDRLAIERANVRLELILGGAPKELQRVRDAINRAGNCSFIHLSVNVPHSEIPEHYARAAALLIPLRPTIQDAARFPHKLGEYLASGRAVITTAYGEILHYDFVDGETALVAEAYDEEAFARKMQYVVDYPEKAREIGRRGREMGLQNFDYVEIGGRLYAFLRQFRQHPARQIFSV